MRRLKGHIGSTAQVCATYPFHAGTGLGIDGLYLGADLLAGGAAFAFDPFSAYAAGLVTAGNMLPAISAPASPRPSRRSCTGPSGCGTAGQPLSIRKASTDRSRPRSA
jgi:hypothetical protein